MQTLVFNGIEGKTFRGKLFKPLKTNGVVMIICPATGVKQRYYFNFANYLAEIGYTVITFDYQGIGESRPKNLRKFQCSATDWYENNLTQVIQYAKQQLNPDKLLLTGHSIGGQLIGLCEASKYADGIVLVGSQMGYWKLWPPRLRARMWFNWYVLVPSFTFIFGYLPAKKLGIMEDLPKEAAREWASWCRSPNHFFDHKPRAKNSFQSLRVPVVSYSFSDDHYAPKNTVDLLLQKYENCTVRNKHYYPADFGIRKIGHFGFFRKENKAFLWVDFIEEISLIA